MTKPCLGREERSEYESLLDEDYMTQELKGKDL